MSLTRRDFLRTSAAVPAMFSLSSTVPLMVGRAAAAAPSVKGETALVVLQLAGGNDGLNTVVPYGDDAYGRVRYTLRLPAAKLHKIDSFVGFHPEMAGFKQLLGEGSLAVVQGVGYPNPNQSHFISMRTWQTADIEPNRRQTGWLGRAVERLAREEAEVPGIFVGQIRQPFTLNAERAVVPSVRSLQDYAPQPLPGPAAQAAHQQRLLDAAEAPRATGNPLLDFVRRTTLTAHARCRQVELAAQGKPGSPAADYPSFPLADELRTVAQLVRADLGLRIYYVELGGEEPGGFDNHANQRDNHASLLRQLSESLAAFFRDLRRDRLLDRVLVTTFSEFGRTVEENGRRGTDHGSAAPVFLAGGRVKGGLLGRHPSLTELENGGLKHHTDFRRLYAAVLDDWLGVDSRVVLGGEFKPLGGLFPGVGSQQQVG